CEPTRACRALGQEQASRGGLRGNQQVHLIVTESTPHELEPGEESPFLESCSFQ
ncbi:hypothetical protein M9458_017694, partial [Cirrhinus mrigala]